MTMMTGSKTFSGSFTLNPKHDPVLSVDDVIWLEEMEPGLLRPTIRARFRVASRTVLDDGSVHYEFDRVGITPVLQQPEH